MVCDEIIGSRDILFTNHTEAEHFVGNRLILLIPYLNLERKGIIKSWIRNHFCIENGSIIFSK